MRRAADPIAPFLAVLALAGLSTGLARVTTSLYAVTIHSTPTELGLLAACQSLGLVLMSLPSGALVRRHGPARVFIGGSLLGGLACAAVPLVSQPWFLIACFTGVGLCMPLRFVSTNVVTMQRIDHEGSARAGWYRGIHLLSMFVVGPSIAVPVVATLGFPVSWWFVAASFVLPAWVARRVLSGARPASDGAMVPALRVARRDPETLPLVATEFAAQGANTCFSFFIIPVAIQQHRFGAAAAAGLLSAQAASFVIVLLALGAIASRWARARFVLASYGSAGVGLMLLGLARGGWWLWVGSLLLGAGLGLVQLDSLVRAARVGARVGQDAASCLQSLSGSSGGLIVGLLGGLIGRAFGTQAVFLLLAPAFGLLAWRQLAGGLTHRPTEAPASPGSAPSRSPASSCGPGACAG
ncbi:MAG: MFS transporter [Anaeromyxobacteraceae bacterium]